MLILDVYDRLVGKVIRVAGRVPMYPKRLVQRAIPPALLRSYRRHQLKSYRRRSARRTPREVFSEVYGDRRWGGSDDFDSGIGSSPAFAARYCEVIRSEIAKYQSERLTIVDLGCGDFRVGACIADKHIQYIGVDVVPDLIERNRQRFGRPGIEFVLADITADELPDGDICLIRQVLQHLSNVEIQTILNRIQKYELVFITEPHDPDKWPKPNVDMPHGSYTRASDGSAVFLDRPPFNLKGLRQVLAVEELKTYRFEPSPRST